MGTPNALRALDPLEFRFTDPADIQRYGDGWFTYNESVYLLMRARDLIGLEGKLGTPMVSVMNGMRASTTLGDTAAAWLGVRAASEDLAGPFDDFNPVTGLIEWRAAEGKAPAPVSTEPVPAVAPELPAIAPWLDPDLPMAGRSPHTNSAPTDTVVLPNLPVEG
jgi:hypothetical protein